MQVSLRLRFGRNKESRFSISKRSRFLRKFNFGAMEEYKPESKSNDHRQAPAIRESKIMSKPNEVNAANYFAAFQPKTNDNNEQQRGKSIWDSSGLKQRKFALKIDPEKDKFGQKLKDINLAGFSFLAATRSYPMRIFWICLILAAISFLTYELWKTINDYISQPIITTYTLQPNGSMTFPKIFICPAVFINGSFYNKNREKSIEALKFLNLYDTIGDKNTTNSSSTNEENMFRKMDDSQNNFDSRNVSFSSGSDVYDFLLQMGFDQGKVFIDCKFYGQAKEMNLVCADSVKPIIDQRYGKCYEFSVGDLQQTTDARGLSLTLDTFSKRYVTDKNLIRNFAGLFVFVDKIYDPTSYETILVRPGTYTKMSLSLQHNVMLKVFQPCKDNDDKNLTILNVIYSRSGCQMECVFQKMIDKCNCVPVINRDTITVLNATNYCYTEDELRCVDEKIDNDEKTLKDIKDCSDKCLSACDSWRYKVRSTNAPLNVKAFEGKLPKNSTVDEIVLLDIAFSRLEYLELVQQPSMTFDTFVGNAGGQITLWIGGCMLTLIPLPFALIAFCVMTCITKCQKRRKSK